MDGALAQGEGALVATNADGQITVAGLVATRDRPADLANLLQSLACARMPGGLGYSLLVVDNSADKSAERVVAETKLPFEVRYLHEPRAGLSRARNAGLRADPSSDIATLDDDIIVPENYFIQLERVLRAYPEAGAIGGRVELFNKDDFPISIRSGSEVEHYQGGTNIFGFIPGCCQIIRRTALIKAGLYDPRLGAGSRTGAAEDDDMIYRIWKQGYDAVYAPELVVFHNHGRSAADAQRLERNYMKGNGAFLAKHMLRLDLNAFAQFRRLIPWCLKAILTRTDKADYATRYLRYSSLGAMQFVLSILRR